MYAWLETHVRALLHRHGINENGEVELLLIVLIAFIIGLLAAGRRIIVQ